MKIRRLRVHAVPLPYRTLGHSRAHTPEIMLHDTVVALETDEGIVGYGESCPLNPTYLHATVGGLRGALEIIGPHLIGRNACEPGALTNLMDRAVRGHEAAKSAVDLAAWDVLGTFAGLPVKTLLGGAEVTGARLYDSIPMDAPDTMVETLAARRAEGITVFQVKLGEGAVPDIARMRAIADVIETDEWMICDANRGWTMEDARQVVAAAGHLPPELRLLIEQPCATHDECRMIRRVCTRPMILDEVIDDLQDLARAAVDGDLDGVVIKLSHAGGLTRAAEMARLATRLGLRMRIEDTVGAEIVRSAVAHLAVTVPERHLLGAYPHRASVSIAGTTTRIDDGRLYPGDDPGLGCDVDESALGPPIMVFE